MRPQKTPDCQIFYDRWNHDIILKGTTAKRAKTSQYNLHESAENTSKITIFDKLGRSQYTPQRVLYTPEVYYEL